MNCPHCNEPCEYDELTDSYYCEECNYLFGEEDIIEEEEEVVVPQNKTRINFISNIILSVFCTLPFVDMLIPVAMSKADIDEKYIQSYAARFLARMLIVSGFLILYITVVMEDRIELQTNVHNKLNALHESMIELNQSNDPIDRVELESKTLEDILADIYVEEDAEVDKQYYSSNNFLFIDDAVVSGATAKELITSCSDKYVAILVNTKSIAKKYNNSTYANFGYIIENAEMADSKVAYMYEGKLSDITELTTNDLGEYVYMDTDSLNNSRYIYYISKSNNYKINIVSKEDIVIAIILTEVQSE